MAGLYINVEFESVKHVTDKAICFVIEGEYVWLPISQISPDDRGQYKAGEGEGSVSITEWIANEKGLT